MRFSDQTGPVRSLPFVVVTRASVSRSREALSAWASRSSVVAAVGARIMIFDDSRWMCLMFATARGRRSFFVAVFQPSSRCRLVPRGSVRRRLASRAVSSVPLSLSSFCALTLASATCRSLSVVTLSTVMVMSVRFFLRRIFG